MKLLKLCGVRPKLLAKESSGGASRDIKWDGRWFVDAESERHRLEMEALRKLKNGTQEPPSILANATMKREARF